jgi:hypothetical protein
VAVQVVLAVAVAVEQMELVELEMLVVIHQ